jgi:dipeptidase D
MNTKEEFVMKSNEEIIQGVLAEFSGLAKYPRPSHHEKAVSDYIVSRLRELGADPIQDAVYNIIADIPATAGMENIPRAIIQGHMDMVCVAKPGVAYDPLTDPIRIKRDGNILSAEGTSLGADDGIAVAVALYLLDRKASHGPLRLIFTVDEETSMTGATHLDPKYVQDAKYIINCDSESIDILVVGSAGSRHTDFSRQVKWQKNGFDAAVTISAHDFLGGHSGETINAGKSNAIKALALLLQRLRAQGISFTLAQINGGVAANAIPSTAQAVLALRSTDVTAVQTAAAQAQQDCRLIYGEVEKNASFTVTSADVPAQTFSSADTTAVIQLLSLLHCGVFAMNQHLPKLPDLSANIGTIKLDGDTLNIQYFPRSSSDARLEELIGTLPVLAELTGFDLTIGGLDPAWSENPHSELRPIMSKIYKELTGKDARVEAMHGGLETGFFYAANPNLDIVSIGATTHDIHSPEETLELDTVALLVRLVARTLLSLS